MGRPPLFDDGIMNYKLRNFRRVGVVVVVVGMAFLLQGCQNSPGDVRDLAGATDASSQQNEMMPHIQGPNSAPVVKGPTVAPK